MVTLELLRRNQIDILPLILNPRGATTECIKAAGFTPDTIFRITRTIHPQLLELNEKGFLNGHTPFSAMLGFNTILASVLSGRKHIALSNESSANESTVEGSSINHQYSKSFEFEEDFRNYVSKYISPKPNYFSFLRPLSELQIADLFSQYDNYHEVFRSCNVGSKTDSWCGNCPKCLFTYSILSPFLGQERLTTIFGKDLFSDIALTPFLRQLAGIESVKPFECVGTVDEVNASLQQTIASLGNGELPSLLDYYSHSTAYTVLAPGQFKNMLTVFVPEHNLEPRFEHIIKTALSWLSNIKKFLEGKHIILVGCGREGISTYRFIRTILPSQPLTIADQDLKLQDKYPEFRSDIHLEFKLGFSYLAGLDDFDLIIKTPGVSFMDLSEQPQREKISSQTDLFLRMFSRQVIGITGTKGKSTTSSLIKHIVSKHTDNAILVGNIGLPPFDMLHQINDETIIICELSSHQLQYITVAPHISILLNLFEEHLDHYNSYLEYQLSKLNIAINQQPDDHFIYNKDDKGLIGLMKEYDLPGMKHPFSASTAINDGAWCDDTHLHLTLKEDQLFYDLNTPRYLPGKHNILNIMAAVLACTLNNIPDQNIIDGIGDFKGLEHRIEYVGTYHGIRYYNDSISTIPQATIAAVSTLKEVDTLILGGFDRGIDYTILINYLADSAIRNLIFIGKAGERICQMLTDAGMKDKHFFRTENFDEVAKLARENTRPGSICLLSPAAASYDMFKNFEERGRVFKEKVSQIM